MLSSLRTPRMHAALCQVLSETDACLQALTRRLGAPGAAKGRAAGGKARAAPAPAPPGGPTAPSPGTSGGDYGTEGAEVGVWGELAQRLVADILEPPALLEGGELRPYQMQVGAGCC
jgi:hypothetical protein